MDRGLLILMSLAASFTVTVILKSMDVLSNAHVEIMMIVSLGYHGCYAMYTIREWKNRDRIRNAKRGNHRPPRRDRY